MAKAYPETTCIIPTATAAAVDMLQQQSQAMPAESDRLKSHAQQLVKEYCECHFDRPIGQVQYDPLTCVAEIQ